MSKELKSDTFRSYGSTSADVEVSFAGNDDREVRITCDSVSTNIYTINSCIKNLKGVLGLLGTPRDNQSIRDQIRVWQLSGNQVIKQTASEIAKLTKLNRNASVQQRLQIKKITDHFKDAVQDYGVVQKDITTKLRWHVLPASQPPENLLEEQVEGEVEQHKVLQQQQIFENELLEEREKRVREIETDVLDIHQLMKELGAMVHEQSAQVDTIESNIEQSRGQVEEGREHLIAASQHQQRLRKKQFYIFGFLAIVLIVLIGIIIWSSR